MALTSETRSVSYVGNGSTTSFSFGHLFFADADLVVKVAGVTKTLTTDYSVTGAGDQDGGTVTFGTAPASGASITIERVVDFTQPTSFRTQGNYSPKVHENALDRVTMQTQQLDARVTTAQADADALDVRLTTAEEDIADLQAHDATEDAAVDRIDARVSALEAGDPPPAPTTEDYTGVASALSARTAPTITRPADGSSLTAEALQTALDALADKVASILSHGGLLDVAGTWSEQQTFSQPVKFSDGTEQDTSATATTTGAITYGTNCAVGEVGDYVTRHATGLVSAKVSVLTSAAIAAGDTLATISDGFRPTTYQRLAAYRVSGGVYSTVPVVVSGAGVLVCGVALADGDSLMVSATYPSA